LFCLLPLNNSKGASNSLYLLTLLITLYIFILYFFSSTQSIRYSIIALFIIISSTTLFFTKGHLNKGIIKTLQDYRNNSNNTKTNGINKRKSTTINMIINRIYVNYNRLITSNKIPIFIMDLLNYQAMLISIMVLVTVNVLQLALCGKAIPCFPTKTTVISKIRKENIEVQQ